MADPHLLPPPASASHGVPAPRPVIIAVDGRSGAGKTTVALELAALLRQHRTVSLFHLEDIYPGWDGLADGVDHYVQTVLTPLAGGRPAHWTPWNWETGTWESAADGGSGTTAEPGDSRTTSVADVVLVEGVGAAHARAKEFLDVVIWVDAPAGQRKRRALERDGDTYAPFWDRWALQEELLFAGGDAAATADIVVDGSEGVADAPKEVLLALTGLPALEALLAPELARRRGLEFSAERVATYPGGTVLFDALYGGSTDAVWLDSSIAQQPGTIPQAGRSRFSIMADSSGSFGRTATHTGGTTTVCSGQVTTRVRAPFFRWLDTVWGRKAVRAPADYPGDFTLGWLGWLGYGLKSETGGTEERPVAGPSAGLAGVETPSDAALLFAGRAVVIDHQERCLFLLTLAEAGRPETRQEAAEWAGTVRGVLAALPQDVQEPPLPPPPAPVFTLRDGEAKYKAMIAASLNEIREGNSYEVCLTTQLESHTPSCLNAWDCYRALRRRSPAPFAAFLRFGATAVCSTSPERFLRIDSAGLMRAEPIKGTRRRDQERATDDALKADLAGSLKDRAENIMIVDLLRNDLSHSAVPGSVAVPRLCAIESYATVHQLVSTIEAQLAPGSSRAEALAATFPAGSMTGAPKISTMAILDALETGPRGIYSGGIGYFSLNAAMDLSVTIRTLVLQETSGSGTHLSLGIGGAITADSDPDAEWQELQAKAHGVLSALGSVFPS